MPRLKLTYAGCKYDRIEALRSGGIEPEGIALNVIVLPSGRQIFDRMVGGEEPNRPTLEAPVRYMVEQHFIAKADPARIAVRAAAGRERQLDYLAGKNCATSPPLRRPACRRRS